MILDLGRWMSPDHCIPDAWFTYFIFGIGVYVAIVYMVFAYQVLFRLKEPLGSLIHKKFSTTLGMVFLMCGAAHLMHSSAYLHEYFKIPNLVIYPLLAFFHTWLIMISNKAVNNLKGLTSFESVQSMRSELNECKNEAARLQTTIYRAYMKKDWTLIAKHLEDD